MLTSPSFPAATRSSTLSVPGAVERAELSEEIADAELMLRYRDGDMQAFALLYQRHKTALYRYVQRLCRHPELANDVFQEVWSKVIASRSNYEVRAQFRTFLYRVARNAVIDVLRRQRSTHQQEWLDIQALSDELPDAPHEQPEARLSEHQLRNDLQQSLDQLPVAQREAFLLHEEAGMSVQEIASVTDVNMETAKSRLRYALNKLRSALQHHQPHHAGLPQPGGTS